MHGTLESRIEALEKRAAVSPDAPDMHDMATLAAAVQGAQATADECARIVGDLEARLNSIGVRLDQIRPDVLTETGRG